MQIVTELNRRLRIVADDRQWIIQSRKGQATPKSSGWRAIKHVTTKQSLAAELKLILGPRYHDSMSTWVHGLPVTLPCKNPLEWSASFRRPTGLTILPECRNSPADGSKSPRGPLRSVA